MTTVRQNHLFMSNYNVARAIRYMLAFALTVILLLALNSGRAFASEIDDANSSFPQETPQTFMQAADTTDSYDQQDLLDAQTNHSQVSILDTEVPMGNLTGVLDTGASNFEGNGSLVNTALAGVCAISMIIVMVSLARRKKVSFVVIAVRTFAVAIGLVTISSWSLLDKLSTPTHLFNGASGSVITLFVFYATALLVSYALEQSIELRARSRVKSKSNRSR